VPDRPAVVLSPRYADAVHYAAEVHADQPRKGTAVPYMAHLLGVSALVLEAGGDEDLAIAGLLHDSAEDHGGEARLADIETRFGARVAGIVRACSDSLVAEGVAKQDWETRKREHLDRLASAPDEVLLVWAADKVHNGRAIVTDLEVSGPGAMARFHAPPDRVLWYYRSNLALLAGRGIPDALLVPLQSTVTRLGDLLA
jgi:(p)ppGpp synthase/HD superfamily hydrolase